MSKNKYISLAIDFKKYVYVRTQEIIRIKYNYIWDSNKNKFGKPMTVIKLQDCVFLNMRFYSYYVTIHISRLILTLANYIRYLLQK